MESECGSSNSQLQNVTVKTEHKLAYFLDSKYVAEIPQKWMQFLLSWNTVVITLATTQFKNKKATNPISCTLLFQCALNIF